MKVYLAERDNEYDPVLQLGIYSTLEAARARIREVRDKDEMLEHYLVREFELDRSTASYWQTGDVKVVLHPAE